MKNFVEKPEIKQQIIAIGKKIAAEQGAQLCDHSFDLKEKAIIYLLKKDEDLYIWSILFKDIKVSMKQNNAYSC